ncbi:MAG TPA: crotonase/enoyl-CoA hydratase family protein [Burkholderiaceae bacterium]|jgi:enoyl-CoA hydratase|nr:crotonase/enoyl-CoA hydratase family protein [Burkholderiaceae bacterium]
MDPASEEAGRIVRRRHGDVLAIGIDRPSKRNGVTPEMARALADAYGELERDPSLRAGLLYAEGAHFTGGLDLPRWGQILRSGGSLWGDGGIDPFDLREPRRTKPVVAAVQGICFTLGIELMLAADVVVAADDCRFSQLEVKRGIMATGGATFRIAERAGTGNAMLYLLTGDEFDSATALRLNLVQRIVPAGRQFDEALAIAQRVAQAAPLAVRATIANARLAREHGPQAAIAEFAQVQARLAASDDAREGVAAFVERRAARFRGS